MGTKIFNSDVIKNLRENAGVMGIDAIPSEIADKIVPTIETNPDLLRKTNFVKAAANATAATIFTCASDRDTYLTGCNISVSSTTAGVNRINITVIPDGETTAVILLSAVCQVGAALSDAAHANNCITFAHPIKLKRGSIIATSITGTNASGQESLWGYTIENYKT